ncbi:hypothetical protein I5693_10565 [Burkholderia cenocepacia]|uniref:hypothetical protein n=1 Tax=Burkholderia TaxID=32008 RepID=UPI000AB6406B|nr:MULTISPECIES: hypothetical protein [Burkholderia]MBJ9667989.1 hypothetical protein [Burkholderia cenocepacia]MBO7837740.1 hypothetical protein [Burkholderia pseudomallei]
MKESKPYILKTRVDAPTADAFAMICAAEGTTPSEMLRNFVVETVRRHALTAGAFSVEIELGPPYGRGASRRDEYYVHATLSANQSGLIPDLVPFLLPEFTAGNSEPFRVDSFYTHRLAMPNSRNEAGRLLGSKMVMGSWEGAIFLYRDADFGKPENCFPEIKEALTLQILKGLGATLAARDAPDLI